MEPLGQRPEDGHVRLVEVEHLSWVLQRRGLGSFLGTHGRDTSDVLIEPSCVLSLALILDHGDHAGCLHKLRPISPMLSVWVERIIALGALGKIGLKVVEGERLGQPTRLVFQIVSVFVFHELIQKFIGEHDLKLRGLLFALVGALRLDTQQEHLNQTCRVGAGIKGIGTVLITTTGHRNVSGIKRH